jgi:hypothetical protein
LSLMCSFCMFLGNTQNDGNFSFHCTKTLGIIYLIVGGVLSLLPLGFFIWAAYVSDVEFEHSLNFEKLSGNGLLMMAGVFLLFLLALSVMFIGIGFLKRRRWARIPALIFCAPAILSFPFGTGLAIYTWWFLHSEGGKQIFGNEPA